MKIRGLIAGMMILWLVCGVACSKKPLELTDEVKQLLDSYDDSVKEYCQNKVKCDYTDGEITEERMKFCMDGEASFDRRKAEDPIPECPNYYMISRALLVKCDNEISKKYGKDACFKNRLKDEAFNVKLQKEEDDCIFGHELLKPYYSCFCDNIEKIMKNSDPKILEESRKICQSRGF